MSKTVGATMAPVANDVPVMPVLMPPVDGYRHAVPPAFRAACNWYCQRAPCGNLNAPAGSGTGAGHPAVTQSARAGVAPKATGATARASSIAHRPATFRVLFPGPDRPGLLDSACESCRVIDLSPFHCYSV